ncbi:hypothetical protein CEXT_550271 [Caerostris extrusa]|uniref:Secreted protein n=1 Tax=Caerostris extrusa TaxID=172846 RepID=A0AAV4W1X6_CAEEX|nr:hypothetical protein CEXT_550271 [Caerostris extrusa]
MQFQSYVLRSLFHLVFCAWSPFANGLYCQLNQNSCCHADVLHGRRLQPFMPFPAGIALINPGHNSDQKIYRIKIRSQKVLFFSVKQNTITNARRNGSSCWFDS